MLIAKLYAIAKTWKQPKCTFNGWLDKDVVHKYNGILLGHKKDEILPFAKTQTDLRVLC